MSFPAKLPSTDITDFQRNPSHKEWQGPFTFVCGADTQFGMIDNYHLKKTEPNWEKEMKLTLESIQRINKMNPKPKFYVICGDMLDAFPYEEGDSILFYCLFLFFFLTKNLNRFLSTMFQAKRTRTCEPSNTRISPKYFKNWTLK